MVNPILPIPAFPDVPLVPGVPAVLRSAANNAVSSLNGAITTVNTAIGSTNALISSANVLAGGSINGIAGFISTVTNSGQSIGTTLGSLGNIAGGVSAAVNTATSTLSSISTVLGTITGPASPAIQTVNGLISTVNSAIGTANSVVGALNQALTTSNDPMTEDGDDVADTSNSPQWGLFDQDGNAVITADSVFGFEYKKTWRIPNYPQEEGSFQSYNKVELPGEPRIVFTQAGSVADRTAFLQQVQAVCASLDLYIAYTPEMQFPSVNPVDYSIMNRTSEQGATLLKVEVALEEVRVSATQQFTSSSTNASPTNTVQPSGQAQQNTGPVQLQTPTTSQLAAVQNSLAQQTLQVA